MEKAIFFDRDGVLNRHNDYVATEDALEIQAVAVEAVRLARDAGYLCFVISNQPQVAMGLCSMEQLKKITDKLVRTFVDGGAPFHGVFCCYHHPNHFPQGDKSLQIVCECRKPEVGLIDAARKSYEIDMSKSAVIGDSWRDMELAKKIGTAGFLVHGEGSKGENPTKFNWAMPVLNVLDGVRAFLISRANPPT